jgi:hypothetical protein
MAYTTINKSSEYFNTLIYTGNDTDGRAITGVGFQPDWVWFKGRTVASDNEVYDAVRGATKHIATNLDAAEATNSNRLQSFDSDGFTLGNSTSVNKIYNYVSWNWLANGAGVSNTDGSITSTVSANTTSGFSIVSYTGTGSNATVGHGLGVTPAMMIVKRIESAGGSWRVYHKSLSATSYLLLQASDASASQANLWNNTEPTSSVFTIGAAGDVNLSSYKHIAYVFAEKKGFSKFGSYTGNGNANGTFVYTGFKPAFILVKNTAITDNWSIFDNKRIGYNDFNYVLYADITNVGSNGLPMDILSNGFKWRTDAGMVNGSGQNHIFMAFAEEPLVGTNDIPATAR